MLSAPIIITPPTASPIDIEVVKLFLRVDGDELDDEIARYIRAGITEIQRITGVFLAEQTVEVQADSLADLEHLTLGPVKEISEIRYIDSAGAEQILDAGSYELVGAPLGQSIRTASVPARQIVVRMIVGYAEGALPADIDLALYMWVRSKFDGTPFDLFEATVNSRIWM